RAMNMAPFIFWNLAFYTIIRTQLGNPMPMFKKLLFLMIIEDQIRTGLNQRIVDSLLFQF
ncbi:hypothetical protein ABNE95_18285, partial [Paenibacillus larvae]